MSLVRFSHQDSIPRPGYLLDDRIVAFEDAGDGYGVGDFFRSPNSLEAIARESLEDDTTPQWDASAVRLHRPVEPEKIVRLEGCYRQDVTDDGFNPRIEKDGLNEMDWPTSWTAPLSSTTGPHGPLSVPRYVSDVRPGLEVGLIVGTKTKHWTGDAVEDIVAGATVGASLTINDELPGLEGYKMFDDAMAVGPNVTPIGSVPLDSAELRLSVDGERVATHRTDEWRFDPAEMISHVSKLVTLKPGDIVFTGDPTRPTVSVGDGENIEATMEGVGAVDVPVTKDDGGTEER